MNQLISNTQKTARLSARTFRLSARAFRLSSRTVRVSALILLLVTGSLITRAGGNDPVENRSGSASTAEVKYIGSHEGDPMFNVLYNNSTGARFSVKLLDSEGHQLFQGVYTDRKFDKKFKVTDAASYGRLTFVIRNFQDNSVQSFEIDSNTRMVEDVEVKEVK